MTINIMNVVKEQFTTDIITKVSESIGEDSGATGKAVAAAGPAILSALVSKASSEEGATSMFGLLKSFDNQKNSVGNLVSELNQDSASLEQKSSGILSNLLGDNVGKITDMISSISGIKTGSASSLLALVAPAIMGIVNKVMNNEGIANAKGLAALLGGQSSWLKALLPAGMGSLLGLANLGDLGSKAASAIGATASSLGSTVGSTASAIGSASTSAASESMHHATQAARAGKNGLSKMMPILAIGALAAIAWMFLRDKNAENTLAKQTSEVSGAIANGAEVAGEAALHAGETAAGVAKDGANAIAGFMRKLSTGFSIEATAGGVENKIIEFIEDDTLTADKATWFTMDGMTFETGNSKLRPESDRQLNNVYQIMKAYPKLGLKLGGYTDNVGKAAMNKKLSESRAQMVMERLVAMGIDSNRLTAEGYGEQFPIATNNTPEGRAQNRRISLRVTAK